MKFLFISFILLLDAATTTAQNFAVAADRMNVLYIGVENPLTITAENCPCKYLVVKSSIGKITGAGCRYIFYSDSGFVANITLYKRQNGKLIEIGATPFRVKRIPPPVARVGPSRGGKIKKNVLAAQQYIRVENEHEEIRTEIDSFSVVIMLGDTSLYKQFNIIGDTFPKELNTALLSLNAGDSVTFTNIFARRKKEILTLAPFTLHVY
ncbi:MAG: GldM family protein [Ferruginibacter sp.]